MIIYHGNKSVLFFERKKEFTVLLGLFLINHLEKETRYIEDTDQDEDFYKILNLKYIFFHFVFNDKKRTNSKR